jgi:hypothetical protein
MCGIDESFLCRSEVPKVTQALHLLQSAAWGPSVRRPIDFTVFPNRWTASRSVVSEREPSCLSGGTRGARLRALRGISFGAPVTTGCAGFEVVVDDVFEPQIQLAVRRIKRRWKRAVLDPATQLFAAPGDALFVFQILLRKDSRHQRAS